MYFLTKKNKIFENCNLIILIFSLIYLSIILYINIPFNYGGDEKIYMKNTINIFSNNVFFSDSYFYFRWGMYLIPSFFYSIFNSNPLTFFLASAIPMFIAFLIYFMILKKIVINRIYFFFIFFFLFWVTNPFIINSTFNLVTEGQGIFIFSIILLLFYKINLENDKSKSNIFFLVFLCFYLYGIKETNAFLVFPILIITFLKSNNKLKFLIIFLGLFFLLIESYFIWRFTNEEIPSRLHYFFLSDKSVFVNRIWWNDPKYLYDDGGILTRWLKIGKISKIFFPLCILVSLFCILKFKNKKRIFYSSIIFLSYIFFITFTFKSLNPLVPYVPVKVENLIIVIPLGILILIEFYAYIKKNKILNLIYLIILISFFLRHGNFIIKLLIPEINKTNHNITNIYQKYNTLDNLYYKKRCLVFASPVHKEFFILFSNFKSSKIVDGKVFYFAKGHHKYNCDKKHLREVYKLTIY